MEMLMVMMARKKKKVEKLMVQGRKRRRRRIKRRVEAVVVKEHKDAKRFIQIKLFLSQQCQSRSCFRKGTIQRERWSHTRLMVTLA